MSIARGRPSWVDFPDLSTIVRASDIETWDAGVYELRSRAYSLKDSAFGAKGDDATNDTAAIAAAIAATPADGVLVAPPGTYLVDNISITSELRLIGAGSKSVVFKSSGSATGPLINFHPPGQLEYAQLSGFSVDVSNDPGISGVYLGKSARSTAQDIYVSGGPSVGFDIQGWGGRMIDCNAFNCTTAGFRHNGDLGMMGVMEDCAAIVTDAATTCQDGYVCTRTTTADAGGLYMRRFRTNRSAGTINSGIRFTSTAVGGTTIYLTMDEVVSDSVNGGPCLRLDACHNVRCNGAFFSRVNNADIAMEISGANDTTFVNSWIPNVDLQKSPSRATFIANEWTQGGATQVVKVDAANAPGDLTWIGNRVPDPATTPLTNDYGVFAKAQGTRMTQTPHEVLSARGSGATRTFAIRDASSSAIGKAKFFQVNAAGDLIVVNDAFTQSVLGITDSGRVQYYPGGSAGPVDLAGSGSPETVITAAVGSTYRRTDGGALTSFYVKESGAGNTGWVPK